MSTSQGKSSGGHLSFTEIEAVPAGPPRSLRHLAWSAHTASELWHLPRQ